MPNLLNKRGRRSLTARPRYRHNIFWLYLIISRGNFCESLTRIIILNHGHIHLLNNFDWHKHEKEDLNEILGEMRLVDIYDPEVKLYHSVINEKIGLQCAVRYLFPEDYRKVVMASIGQGGDLDDIVEKFSDILKIPRIALEKDLKNEIGD